MKEIEKITSRDNRRLVNVRKVRDGKASEQIFVEGRRLVEEALRSGLIIDECFVVDDFLNGELVDAVARRTDQIFEISKKLFSSIADTERPQGIILIAKRPTIGAESIGSNISSATLPVVVFLSEINNPSNLGAIMRTAEAAGVAGVVVSANSADVYSPKALRGAMGASFRLSIWENADLEEALRWAKERDLTTTAADIAASCSYDQINWKTPRLLVFGSEAHGLRSEDLEQIDEKAGIPMANAVESLNIAVSAGIILFEARRQLVGDSAKSR